MSRYDVCIPRLKKDGTTRWHKVGMAFDGDKGMSVYLDSLPLPDKDGRCVLKLFEAKPREEQSEIKPPMGNAPRKMKDVELDDEIPF